MPQSRFCIAMARPNTSRPQPYSVVIGIWNSPAEARGPKVIRAMAQPAATTSSRGDWRDADPAMASFQPRERLRKVAEAGKPE